jgi:hypothetical protein
MKSNSLMRTFFLLSFVLIAATAAAGQSKSQAWLKGTWEGTGYQIDDKTTWEMKLTARGARYSIEYPSLNCGGRWQLLSINSSRARFREILNHGQDKCADQGTVLVQRLSRKQVVFLYAYQGTREISASAVLTRKPSR